MNLNYLTVLVLSLVEHPIVLVVVIIIKLLKARISFINILSLLDSDGFIIVV